MQKPDFNFFNEVEKIDLAEDLFGTNVPLDMAFDNPREIVDYLVSRLKGWGPNPVAANFMKQLATKRNSPTLAQGLGGGPIFALRLHGWPQLEAAPSLRVLQGWAPRICPPLDSWSADAVEGHVLRTLALGSLFRDDARGGWL
jgi:hypothetical protein